MKYVLWLLAIQGSIGAFDTFYYHEWRAQLPACHWQTAPELKIHALRDFFYAIIFASLPWIAWHGVWAIIFSAVIIAEIVLTFTDFIIEKRVRKPLGDVFAGERVTHSIMGIIYGGMLANLIPELMRWYQLPMGLTAVSWQVPQLLKWILALMAAGVFVSGLRDLYAAYGLPYGAWPWKRSQIANASVRK